MLLLSFLFPILAHEGESMSVSELMISVGLLVISAGIATTMLLIVILKPVLRARRQRKEGRQPNSNTSIYMVLAAVVVSVFLGFAWRTAWAAYYDYHFQAYEEKLEASGTHPKKGAEYKWERWHIYGRYGTNGLSLFVDDVLGKADPKTEITASARKTSPTATDWQPMKWDESQKAFIAPFPPEGQKMNFLFRFKSGWHTFEDEVIGYVPRNVMQGRENLDVAR